MEIGDGEAEAGVCLEATGGSEHPDGWWFEWVLRGEHEGTPVLAVVVGGVWGAGKEVVPSVGGCELAVHLASGCGDVYVL